MKQKARWFRSSNSHRAVVLAYAMALVTSVVAFTEEIATLPSTISELPVPLELVAQPCAATPCLALVSAEQGEQLNSAARQRRGKRRPRVPRFFDDVSIILESEG